MASYNAHITFLDDVWGLCASNLDAFRNVERTKRVPTQADGRFVLDRYHVLVEQENRDPSTLLEELVEMGPSVATLFEISMYLRITSNSTVAVPKSKSKLQRMNRDKHHSVPQQQRQNDINQIATSTFVTADQCVLEMSGFTLWYHGFVQEQLNTINLTTPDCVFIPLQTHNEIVMMFGAVVNLSNTNCNYLELFPDSKLPEADRKNSVRVPFSAPQQNIKLILKHVCYRLNPQDMRFWRRGSVIISIMLQSFRLCCAMAEHGDETYLFASGTMEMTLDRILVNILNCEFAANPDILRALANQMVAHKTLRVTMRGRLVTAYDLLAMVPAAQTQISNPDVGEASEIVDARPRARMMQYCLKKSPPNSNLMSGDSKNWKARVLTASLLVFVGGVLSSMQANSRII